MPTLESVMRHYFVGEYPIPPNYDIRGIQMRMERSIQSKRYREMRNKPSFVLHLEYLNRRQHPLVSFLLTNHQSVRVFSLDDYPEAWQCGCGRFKGVQFKGEVCPFCNSAVERCDATVPELANTIWNEIFGVVPTIYVDHDKAIQDALRSYNGLATSLVNEYINISKMPELDRWDVEADIERRRMRYDTCIGKCHR